MMQKWQRELKFLIRSKQFWILERTRDDKNLSIADIKNCLDNFDGLVITWEVPDPDKFFLSDEINILNTGEGERGIMCNGRVQGDPYERIDIETGNPHYYIDIEVDFLVDPTKGKIIEASKLVNELPFIPWMKDGFGIMKYPERKKFLLMDRITWFIVHEFESSNYSRRVIQEYYD